MGLSPTASVELLAHLCRDGEARGHVQPPLGHLTQVGALATQLQGRGGGRGGEGRGGRVVQPFYVTDVCSNGTTSAPSPFSGITFGNPLQVLT